jgi:hypothetical protein
MRFRPLIVAIVALAALAGCSKTGGSTPTNGAAPNPADAAPVAGGQSMDVCSLLTTAEATAVLGKPAKDGAAHSYQNTRQCQWDAADGAGSIAILVYIGGEKDKWQSVHDQSKIYPKFADVPGLGDAAFSNGIDLHVLKGDDMYQIGVLGIADNVQGAITVAKEALARV